MNLKDKASRVIFPVALPATSGSNDVDWPGQATTKTAPGAMMGFANARKSEMLLENEKLKEKLASTEHLQNRLDQTISELKEWDGSIATRLLDPSRIRRSKFANRHELNFAGSTFDELKTEIFAAGGNVQPIKVRPIASTDDKPLYEVVFGHRRHAACLQLNLQVLCVIDNLNDQSLFIEMDRENRARKDLSPWEQGRSYLQALELGLFPSNRKLADALGVDLTNLGRALTLARLPSEVVDAFPSPMDIQYRWATRLGEVFCSNPRGMVEKAKAIKVNAALLSAKDIFQALSAVEVGGSTVLPPIKKDIVFSSMSYGEVTFTSDKSAKTLLQFSSKLTDAQHQALISFFSSIII
uniref:Partitioning protein ParB n=1 Tax=Polaromonas sp. E10S TaxID=1840239 RepID=A0A2S1FII9_9BURK|nr:ParB/RepB/Spo0J family partition protein [Polaromonas sp. E10S]AWD72016.1 partitioning protein ParB [Polaromonas sp. E10S]